MQDNNERSLMNRYEDITFNYYYSGVFQRRFLNESLREQTGFSVENFVQTHRTKFLV